MTRDQWLKKIKNDEQLHNEDLQEIEKIIGFNPFLEFRSLYGFIFTLKKFLNSELKNVLISAPFPRAIVDILEIKDYKIYKTRLEQTSVTSTKSIKNNFRNEYIFEKKRKGKFDLIILDPFLSRPINDFEKETNREILVEDYDPNHDIDYLNEEDIYHLYENNLSEKGKLVLFDHCGVISSSKSISEINENSPPKFNELDILFFKDNIILKFPKVSKYTDFKNYFKPYLENIFSIDRSLFRLGSRLFDDQFYLINKNINYDLTLTSINAYEGFTSKKIEKSIMNSEDFWNPKNYLERSTQYGYKKEEGLTNLSEYAEFIQGNDWIKRLYDLKLITHPPEIKADSEDFLDTSNPDEYILINELDVISGSIKYINNEYKELSDLDQKFLQLLKFNFNDFKEKAIKELKEWEFYDSSSKSSKPEQQIINLKHEIPDESKYLIKKGDLCITIDGNHAILIVRENTKFLLGKNLIAIRSEYNNFFIDLFYSNNRNNIFSYYFKKENILDSREYLNPFFEKIKIPLFNDISELENILSQKNPEEYKKKLLSFFEFNFFKFYGWRVEIDMESQNQEFYFLSVNGKKISFLVLTKENYPEDILKKIPKNKFIDTKKGFVVSSEGKCFLLYNKKLTPTHNDSLLSPNELFPGEYPNNVGSNQNNQQLNEYLMHIANKVDSSIKLQEKIYQSTEEIHKDVNDTKINVIKIGENVESLIQIEKIKLKFGSKDEEKCINEILSFIEKKVEFNEVNTYKDEVVKWFKSWDKLEPLSQEFMSQSEFLYDSIQKSKFTDFSPFILYYCRVLEYELLNKIFIKYHDFLAKNHIDKEKLFEFEPKGLKKSTIKDLESGMMKFFKLKVIKNDAKYTLGEMRLILNILPTKSKPQGSERYKALKALQELNYFINDKIGNIESEIIVKIENIVRKYRNPSAHVGTINKESADEFYSIYKTTMNDLFDSFH